MQRLRIAQLLASHSLRDNEVHEEDFIMLPSQLKSVSCNVSENCHGGETFSCSCTCSLPSSSGIIWRWPKNNDVLGIFPDGTGRTIIRRLAYKVGIVHMTADAFDLAEVELIHTIAILLIEAYEESVKLTTPSLTKKPAFNIELEHVETAAKRRHVTLPLVDAYIEKDKYHRRRNGDHFDGRQYRISW